MSVAEPTTKTLDRFAADAKAVVVGAQALADERKHRELEPLHVFSVALSKDRGVADVLSRAAVDPSDFQAALERALGTRARSTEPAYLSASTLDLLERAEREAARERRPEVTLPDLLNALTQELRGALGEVLAAFRLGPGSLRGHAGALRAANRPESALSRAQGDDELAPSLLVEASDAKAFPVVGRALEVRRLLTVLERRGKCHPLLVGEPGVGKRALVMSLARRLKAGDVPTSLAGARLVELLPSALLSGARLRGDVEERVRKLLQQLSATSEPGILVVRGLDQLFGSNPAFAALPALLRRGLDQGQLRLLGTTTPDGLRKIEERDAAFLQELTLLEVLEPSDAEALEMLRAVGLCLARHHQVEIRESAIGTSLTLARRYLRDRKLPDSAIDLLDETAAKKRVTIDGLPELADSEVRRLESVEAQLATGLPLDAGEPVRMRLLSERDALVPRVKAIRETSEARRGSVAAARTLKAELQQARAELEAARGSGEPRARELETRLIPELEARLTRAEEAARGDSSGAVHSQVLAEDVAATLAAWTGIPVQRMLEGETERLLGLEQRLRERVVGQDHALSALAKAVRRGRTGLGDPRRPIGSFLFLGPSGVGKTELCKALASQLFDDERALIRLDMSEFMERHMAQRLIGAPPGYADSEQGGFLTEAVRRRPYSVILFDEVEKAHQDVFNLLLQLLDDGRLTDGRGRTADFSNTVVILTSNIGSERVLESDPSAFADEAGRDALKNALLVRLREFFRPELLNRIDEVLVFRALGKAELSRVVEIELASVGRRLGERGRTLRVTDAAKARLGDLGYEPALGARPLKRTILRHVQDPLAEGLLARRFVEGAEVVVDVREGVIELQSALSAGA